MKFIWIGMIVYVNIRFVMVMLVINKFVMLVEEDFFNIMYNLNEFLRKVMVKIIVYVYVILILNLWEVFCGGVLVVVVVKKKKKYKLYNYI